MDIITPLTPPATFAVVNGTVLLPHEMPQAASAPLAPQSYAADRLLMARAAGSNYGMPSL